MRAKTLSFPLAGILLASGMQSQAATQFLQTAFTVQTDKQYRQFGSSDVSFEGGSFNAFLHDGILVYSCEFPFDFSAGGGCPNGATAYLYAGTSDVGPYFDVSNLYANQAAEPGYASRVRLVSAPASTLKRPLTGFLDDSLKVFYNMKSNTGDVKSYSFTRYFYSKSYTSRKTIESDIVPGVYNFAFPRKNSPQLDYNVQISMRNYVEGYADVRGKKSGFRFTGLRGFTSDGFAVMDIDPAASNVISWEGITTALAFPAADKLSFSIHEFDDGEANKFIFTGDSTDPTIEIGPNSLGVTGPAALFPPFRARNENGDAQLPRVALDNPFIKSYTLPPSSFDRFSREFDVNNDNIVDVDWNRDGLFNDADKNIFFPAGEYLVRLSLERELASNSIAYDTTRRDFELPIKFFNLYATYKATAFTDSKLKKKQGDEDKDYDGDGVSNYKEWVLLGNAASAASVPGIIPMPNATIGVAYSFTTQGYVIAPYPQRTSGSYTAQISYDNGVTWSTLVSGGGWNVQVAQPPILITNSNPTVAARLRLVPPASVTYSN